MIWTKNILTLFIGSIHHCLLLYLSTNKIFLYKILEEFISVDWMLNNCWFVEKTSWSHASQQLLVITDRKNISCTEKYLMFVRAKHVFQTFFRQFHWKSLSWHLLLVLVDQLWWSKSNNLQAKFTWRILLKCYFNFIFVQSYINTV